MRREQIDQVGLEWYKKHREKLKKAQAKLFAKNMKSSPQRRASFTKYYRLKAKKEREAECID